MNYPIYNAEGENINVEDAFDEYQDKASATAIYPREHQITYPLLGLSGEVGEFCNKYKKVLRDNKPLDREDLAAELGDILWYVSAVASDLKISLGYIATQNLAKLKDRQERNVLGGSGDKR